MNFKMVRDKIAETIKMLRDNTADQIISTYRKVMTLRTKIADKVVVLVRIIKMLPRHKITDEFKKEQTLVMFPEKFIRHQNYHF